MNIELEVKFHPIDIDDMRRRLQRVAAHLVKPEVLQRRIVYRDLPITDPHIRSRFMRVRDEGDRITLTYKTYTHEQLLEGQREIEVVVSDFDATVAIMDATGMTRLGYQENRREIWTLRDCEICLDTWPGIGSLIEIEGPDEAALRQVSEQLDLAWSERVMGAVGRLYHKVHGVDILTEPKYFERLTFEEHMFGSG